MLAEALVMELQERYPKLGLRRRVYQAADGTVQITSTVGLRIVLVGSRVVLTCGAYWQIPNYYVPDIDLAQPDSLDSLCKRIELIWKHAT